MEFQHWPCPPGSPLLAQPLAGVAVPSPGFAAAATAKHRGPSTEGPCPRHGPAAQRGDRTGTSPGWQRDTAARSRSWAPPCRTKLSLSPVCPHGAEGSPGPPLLRLQCRLSLESPAAPAPPIGCKYGGRWKVSAALGAPGEHPPSATTRRIPPPPGLMLPQSDQRRECWQGGSLRLQMEGQLLENRC